MQLTSPFVKELGVKVDTLQLDRQWQKCNARLPLEIQ